MYYNRLPGTAFTCVTFVIGRQANEQYKAMNYPRRCCHVLNEEMQRVDNKLSFNSFKGAEEK